MKKKLVLLWVAICLSAVLFGCGTDEKQVDKSKTGYDVIRTAGYYKDVRMQPNGEFLARYKIEDSKGDSSGMVYKVDFNDKNKIEKITSMYGGSPINVEWRDTLDHGFTFSTVTIEYQDGYEKYNFKNTRMASTEGFYGAYSIRYKIDDTKKNHRIAYLYNKQGEQANTDLGYAQMLFTYDDKGNLYKVGYAGTNGERVTTAGKDYEIRFKYDKGKKPIEIANYGKDESLMVDASGIAKTTYKFDGRGRTIEVRHFGADESLKEKNSPRLRLDDKVITSVSSGAITKYSYEGDNDEPSSISFFGKDEQPIGIKAWGNIASLKFKYTTEGQIAELSSFGTDDTPIPLDKDEIGDNVVKLSFAYDDRGNLSKITFYGKEDSMVIASKMNAAESRRKYDEKRRLTEKSYFGTGEDAIDVKLEGRTYHRVVYEYNDDDEITLCIYYDKAGKELTRETPKPSQKTSQKPSQKTSASNAPENGEKNISLYITEKNQYDREIAALAQDINAYLSSNANFRNGGALINRAEGISQRINSTKSNVISTAIPNPALKAKLIEVLDAELGRVNGLLDGMRASRGGGDYHQGFQRGTDAAYRFDDVNASLNKML